MKSIFRLFFIVLLMLVTNDLYSQSSSVKTNSIIAEYVTLSGSPLQVGNPTDAAGNVSKFNSPVLRLMKTSSSPGKGTILLFPGGGYDILKMKDDGEKMAGFLNTINYDVAILEYHVNSGLKTRDLALADALKAFRLLKMTQNNLGLNNDRVNLIGIGAGGHLAARMVRNLDGKEQPDNLILISPSYLNETITGTVIPAIMPPVKPVSRLLCVFYQGDNYGWTKSSEEYTKTWKGYDGSAIFHLLSYSVTTDVKHEFQYLLKTFLEEKPSDTSSLLNPAAIPSEGYSPERHREKLALVAKEKYDLIFIGNSITNNFEKPEYQPVWNQFFAPRKALNLGYSGYRTENILWNIQNGELEGQSPKVIILEIGTNNVDEKNYPTRHTAGQLAGGIEAIVKLLREKLPETRIIILRSFPGCYDGPNPTSHRAILDRASDIVSGLADGEHIFYCDVNHVFLNIDGSIKHELMPDWLHPNPAGAKAWAQAMEPLLSELMGDKSLDSEIPANSAIVPATKLENDFYDWWARHSEVLQIKDSVNPEIVLIGNSITHFWGGVPKMKNSDGSARKPNGPDTWASLFGNYRVLNLGFGWDRTQNVLWRLDHGELNGLQPRIVVLLIGSNNTSQTLNARMNTATEIVEGIDAICCRIRSKVPATKIILMAILPREESPVDPRRIMINEINSKLESYAAEKKLTFVNIGPKMLTPDGTLTKDIAGDFCHPTEKGYQIWADAIRPLISEPF
jgi:lysophospholipase L1-like esterase